MKDSPSTIQTALRLGVAWARVRLLGQRIPLLMSFNLTFRCNLRCSYCAAPTLKVPQMDTDEVKNAIDQCYAMGTRWITFSGGEPLMRKDIRTLIDHSMDKGIVTFISTNGTLVPKRIDDIRRIDRVTISLDGAGEVHDRVRGEGSFEQAIRAIETCQENGLDVALTCVLSKLNLESLDDVLELAAKYGVTCMFQPATPWLDSSTDPNPIAPPTEGYRAAVQHLMRRKKAGGPITNSMAGLKYLADWPESRRIFTTAGKVTCSIEPDGKMLASHLTQADTLEQEVDRSIPLREVFQKLPVKRTADQSWCGPILELDLLFALNPSAILNAIRIQA